MKTIIELKLGTSLLTITFSMLGGINHAIAQTCITPPSCATLGYKQSASDCTGQQMLKCPFDNSKVFCGGTDCDSSFTLSSCDTTKGFCITCNGKYKYTSCNNGWTLSNGNCVADCSSFTLSSCPSNAYCSNCKDGATTYYKFSSCYTNYQWSGISCIYKDPCEGYNNRLSGYQTSYVTCINRGTTYYKETACKSGKCTRCRVDDGRIILSGNECECYNGQGGFCEA